MKKKKEGKKDGRPEDRKVKLKTDNLCCLYGHLFLLKCVCVGTHMSSTHVEDRAHAHESVPSFLRVDSRTELRSPVLTAGVSADHLKAL